MFNMKQNAFYASNSPEKYKISDLLRLTTWRGYYSFADKGPTDVREPNLRQISVSWPPLVRQINDCSCIDKLLWTESESNPALSSAIDSRARY